MLNTRIDDMVALITKKGKITFAEISKTLSWNEASIEKIALLLEKAGFVETHYPADMIRKPWLRMRSLPLPIAGVVPGAVAGGVAGTTTPAVGATGANPGANVVGASTGSYPVGSAPSVSPSPQNSKPGAQVSTIEVRGKELERYEITGSELIGGEGHVQGTVRIIYSNDELRPVYSIAMPEASAYTRAYLQQAKSEAAKTMQAELLETGKDESAAAGKKTAIKNDTIIEILKRDLDPDQATLDALVGIITNEMFGMGAMEAIINDGRLEEVIVNSSTLPVSVYHRKYGWLKTNIYLENERETENYAAQIARKAGRQISLLNPILDARLTGGERANATLQPISSKGNTITLRLFSKNPWTFVTYLKEGNRSMSVDMAALLWQAMQYEMNIIIAGGTASGKTSALNGLVALIQPFQRIVSIEDTRELTLPSYQWNWVPLVTRPPNPEGFGEVTMLDLVVNALRMRPDRIVMGEIRRKKEAEVLFEAMRTGHSVYATIHADTGAQVVKRLTEPPIELPPSEVEDVHLVLVQYRDRRRNLRRTLEISEIVPGVSQPELSCLYKWKARNDTFEMVKAPRRYVEQMNLHTGMTEKEVLTDLKNKATIFGWMVKNKLEDVESVGKVMKAYYSDEATITKAADAGTAPSKVL